ncbi:dihydroorotate dehydrogenase electron transfer subunit [Chloroflexota bacterium]
MKQNLSRIISSEEVMPGICLMWFKAPEIAATAKPGQFFMLQCGADNLLRRPFSVHNVEDNGGNIAVLFSVVGRGTKWLSQRRAGEKIDILGPLGNGYAISPASRNILMVGGGIGIAPLPFLVRTAVDRDCSVILLYGAATAAQLCPDHLIPAEAKCVLATDDGTAHTRGFITDLLPEYIGRADQIFACGPVPLYRTMAKMPQLKYKPIQLSLEMRMGCGFGACYSCTIKTKRGLKQVCQDGPVFNLDDILWDELVDI